MSVLIKPSRLSLFGVLSLMLMTSVLLSACGEPNGLMNTRQGGATILTVNGKVVTKNEYDKAYEQAAKQMGIADQPQSAQSGFFSEMLKQQTVQQLVSLSVIEQAVETNKIVVTPEELKAKRQDIITQVGGLAALQSIFKQNDMTEADFNYQLKQMVQLEKLVAVLGLVKTPVSQADVASYYKAHEIEFDLPKQISSAHILIKAIPAKIRADIQAKNKSITPADLEKQVTTEVQAKKKQTETLLAEVLKDPEKFGALAERHSEDTMSQIKKGDVGFMQQRSTDPGYWKALEVAKRDQIVPTVVKSAYGFHIIKVGETKPATKKSLADARVEIQSTLENQQRQQAIGMWLDREVETLKNQKKLVISEAYDPASPERIQKAMEAKAQNEAKVKK
ncbi:MAG: hypothetical protein HEQ32_08940 [Vampirovibrio sp.]